MIKIKKHKTVLILTVVLALLIFLHWLGALKPVEDFFVWLAKPLTSRFYRQGEAFNAAYSARQERQNLAAQVEALSQEVARLTVANANDYALAEENKQLRAQLDFISGHNFQAVTAGVIAQETAVEATGANQDLIINRGLKDGLRLGLGVISPTGVIIGKIVDLKDTTARVCLTTTPGCKLAAAVQNADQTQGLTDGDLGLTIKMSYIPQTEKIAADDLVVSSGLGGDIPHGLVIGKISHVINESNEVWQEATIVPLVNLSTLTVVSVIIP